MHTNFCVIQSRGPIKSKKPANNDSPNYLDRIINAFLEYSAKEEYALPDNANASVYPTDWTTADQKYEALKQFSPPCASYSLPTQLFPNKRLRSQGDTFFQVRNVTKLTTFLILLS